MMRQSIGCSTPAPRSSAAKQWIERTRSNDEEEEANEFPFPRSSHLID